MNDLNQLEIRSESLFKDAVLSLAEAKSMEIIAEAGRKRAEELETAYKLAEASDYETVKAKYSLESNKEFMAVSGQVRHELLQYRDELVHGFFEDVREKLYAFVESAAYPAYLAGLLQAHTAMASGGGPLTVWLRGADLPLAETLKSVCPTASFEADAGIRLGGLKVGDGKRLFDETMDEKLRGEMERFTLSGHMRVPDAAGMPAQTK